jgi:hypothetical protein
MQWMPTIKAQLLVTIINLLPKAQYRSRDIGAVGPGYRIMTLFDIYEYIDNDTQNFYSCYNLFFFITDVYNESCCIFDHICTSNYLINLNGVAKAKRVALVFSFTTCEIHIFSNCCFWFSTQSRLM